MTWPQFFLIGAPKAGTTALHAALAQHPQLFLPRVKEPKYYLCDGRPPSSSQHRGPGDRHSSREWVWSRERYAALYARAPHGTLAGDSTPFCLYDAASHARIHRDVPAARLIAVLRDPVDRAYSNWMHLWSDGLEPESDFLRALEREDDRVAAGWAPFWHYRRLGRYAEQLARLFEVFPRDQVLLLRYRDLVDFPEDTLARATGFLGVADLPLPVRAENSRPYVADTPEARRWARVIRAGAAAGAYLPPQAWRRVERRLHRRLQAGGGPRPVLDETARQQAVAHFADDIRQLESLTGDDYGAWRSKQGRQAFSERRVRPQG